MGANVIRLPGRNTFAGRYMEFIHESYVVNIISNNLEWNPEFQSIFFIIMLHYPLCSVSIIFYIIIFSMNLKSRVIPVRCSGSELPVDGFVALFQNIITRAPYRVGSVSCPHRQFNTS
jgi:hypothetical protein